MNLGFFIAAALLLSLERISYILIWYHPERFQQLCRQPLLSRFGDPVDVLQLLFYGFKAIQLTVFIGWCYLFGNGDLSPFTGSVLSLVVGSMLIVIGQVLNFSVFYRLGKVGVFYGNRFGHQIPWCDRFPFSLIRHPQYVGTLVSIWGFFLVMRYPYGDWFVLPALQTVYYWVGARFEQ